MLTWLVIVEKSEILVAKDLKRFLRSVFRGKLERHLNFADTLSLVFAGDINFSDPVRFDVKRHLYSYNDTLKRVAQYIREADIAFGNLESPFVPKQALSGRVLVGKRIFLEAEKKSAPALRFVLFHTCLSLLKNLVYHTFLSVISHQLFSHK